MHLLREGQFSVASTFLQEIADKKAPAQPQLDPSVSIEDIDMQLDVDQVQSGEIRNQFATMYHILHELKEEYNLLPAIQWSRENRHALEMRGSNLEFELCRLQFIWLFHGGKEGPASGTTGPYAALEYARKEFQTFIPRYLGEVQQLVGAMAFCPNLEQSPYRAIFNNPSAWADVANTFTREFCSLLGLSADSPLYIAATAGAIALPTLYKLHTIMKTKRTEWTTQNELPVSIWRGRVLSYQLLTSGSSLGRNPSPSVISVPFDIRMPRFQGADDGPEPADDDAVWTRYCAGISNAAEQGQQIQMPLLPQRKSSTGSEKGPPVTPLKFARIVWRQAWVIFLVGRFLRRKGLRSNSGLFVVLFEEVKASGSTRLLRSNFLFLFAYMARSMEGFQCLYFRWTLRL